MSEVEPKVEEDEEMNRSDEEWAQINGKTIFNNI